MSLVPEQHEFAQQVALLLQMAAKAGFTVTLGEAWRSMEQQQIYLQTGRSQTQFSNHLRRLAIDLNFFRDGALVQSKDELQVLGDWWESLDAKNRWGGNWKSFVDIPHFERNVKA